MRKAFIVLLVLVLAVPAGLAIAWQAKSQTIMTSARELLEQEVTKALGSFVSVGAIEIQGISSVVITDIHLRDKQGQTAATAERVTVAFNPLLLASAPNPVDAIHTVTVESPGLNIIERSDASWNLEDFIKEKKPGSPQFGGTVRISRGSVSVQSVKFGSYKADTVNGELDFRAKPSIQLDVKGNHNGAWFTAAGFVNGSNRDAITVNIDSLSLPNYQEAIAKAKIKLPSGQATNITVTAIREKAEWQYTAEASVKNLFAEAEGITIENGSALVCLNQDAISLYNAELELWGQPLSANGTIHYQSAPPVFAIHAKSEAFNLSALPVATGISGYTAFDITVKGTQADFAARGKVSMPDGQYQKYAFADATGSFAYSGGILQLTDVKAVVFGGQVRADGIIDTQTLKADLRIGGRQVDAAQLARLAGVANTGARADFDLLLRGGLSLPSIDVAGSIALSQGMAAGVPFKSAYGGLHLQQGTLTVDYLNAVIDSGMTSAKGTWNMKQDALSFEITGHNLSLATLNPMLPVPAHAAGALRFTALLTGKPADPRVTITATAEHGAIFAQPFEQLSGEAEISRTAVFLRNVQAVNSQTVHRIDGNIQLADKKELNITVATRKARMEALLQPLPITESVTGNVDNDISITGTLDNPSVDGLLALSEGSWRGFLLNSVKGAYRYRNGFIEIENTVINSLDNQVVVNGTVTGKGELALRLTGNDIDLARLSAPYPYPVTGKARVSVSLAGMLEAPRWDGHALIPRLTANGQTFENIEAKLTGTLQEIDCPRATFVQGQSTYSLSGGFNFATTEIYGSLQAVRVQASAIAALAKLNPAIVQGEVNGHFTWNGTIANPGAAFSGSVANGIVKGYQLGDVELEAELVNHVITLEKLMVKQSAGLMAAQGKIDLKGDTSIEAGARDIDAAFFAKMFDSTIETKGRLSFTAQISGKTKALHTAVSLEIANGSVAGAGFDNLFGLLVFDKGEIQVDQLLLSKGEYKASAYGVIPLAALNPESRKKSSTSDQLNLTFRLDNANLSILPFMTKAISSASGETKGEIKVTGNLFQPKLNGQITLKDGTIKFLDIEEPIQKVTVDIRLKDDKIFIHTVEGALGAGKYRLAGSAALRDMAVHDYDLALMLDNASVTHKYFKGPVNGQLNLSEKNNLPHLAGKLVVANTTVNIPMVSTSAGTSNFDMGMNVELAVGEKVRLYNPMLYDVWVEGKVNLNGRLQEPELSGKIESIRGTLNYLRTQFRIDEAAVAFTQFRSFEPVLTLKATTRLEQTGVNLAVDGPVTAMTVKLTSDPQMSQQEILSLLTLRNKFTERQASGKRDTELGRDELVSMLDAGLQLQFFAEVEGMFRNSLGVDEFRVVRGSTVDQMFTSGRNTAEQDQYKIEIGKYVSDQLMLRYSTGVNSNENSYGARYDITKRISLTADVDKDSDLRVGIGMRFRY